MVSDQAIKGVRSSGAVGSLSNEDALSRILSGTGFIAEPHSGGVAVVRAPGRQSSLVPAGSLQLAQTAPPRAAVETVTVTSSKLGGGDVQSIPIAITALSQEQLTATQTAGGPDLIKQVPNMTFTKTNFSGYSIQIRGIGTQAISVTTDPAVAVAFNDMPFIRNHFFEQEFFDLGQVEVVRGPQGTLYGRNATAGVVNLSPAKPTDQFEAMTSGELGNYHQRRFEGMINLPIVDDRLNLRVAGEWTKRQGYSFNAITDQRIDGRDLWSGRVTLGFKPAENLQTYLVWEHFSEDDDRLRSSKQLCKRDPGPDYVDGHPVEDLPGGFGGVSARDFLSQGCLPTSLYSSDAFQVVNGRSLPYFQAVSVAYNWLSKPGFDPYIDTTQSHNLRIIDSTLDPTYKAKSDLLQFNADYKFMPSLTFTSQTGFNNDFLFATQDYNRFNTAPGLFRYDPHNDGNHAREDTTITTDGFFCDPQLGCSNRLVAQDLVKQHSWQLNQEFRLSSSFSGPLNFSVGGNYMHYETAENYYVFINTISLFMVNPIFGGSDAVGDHPWVPGVSDNHECLIMFQQGAGYPDPNASSQAGVCGYIDPNPMNAVNDQGHNYFLSQNPYLLNSYAVFGEAYYNVTNDLKLIGGLRFTEDEKHFTMIPSRIGAQGYGYPSTGTVDQAWGKFTGRFAANWTPKLDFTDQSLFYASYARGYKAGGANPPGAVLLTGGVTGNPVHPITFAPEYINAFELGTKNTLLDGAVTFNAAGFYYDYKGYQISEIVDRTAINQNFDATVRGAEVETIWEPLPGFRLNASGGWQHTELANGSKSVDLMDRTAGQPGWMVVKPGITEASNCILPPYVVAITGGGSGGGSANGESVCAHAYLDHLDPVTGLTYNPTDHMTQSPTGGFPSIPVGYQGFDPASAPNNGAGFDKDLSGNALPNAPPLTVSVGAQYTIPLSSDWAGTLRSDYYWQDYSWARVFNDRPYDRLRGYTNLNLTLILTSQNGWQVMLYDKNVFNTTDITGAFLNSDDSGLTTNVFLTDPKLIGIRVTKNW